MELIGTTVEREVLHIQPQLFLNFKHCWINYLEIWDWQVWTLGLASKYDLQSRSVINDVAASSYIGLIMIALCI